MLTGARVRSDAVSNLGLHMTHHLGFVPSDAAAASKLGVQARRSSAPSIEPAAIRRPARGRARDTSDNPDHAMPISRAVSMYIGIVVS